MTDWPDGVDLPLTGEIAVYDGEEYRANPSGRRPEILLWMPEEDLARVSRRDGIRRNKPGEGSPRATVPITQIERYFYRGCRATWFGLEVGVGPHGPDDVTIYHNRDPSLAAAMGMIGNQYDGFHLEVPFSELQDIEISEDELPLWHRGLMRPWPRGTDLPRVGLLASLHGREFFAGTHPHDPAVHLLMSDAELVDFFDPAELSRDTPPSGAPRVTVARESLDRLFTRRLDATWNGLPVGVRPNDHATVTVYYDDDPTVEQVPGMGGTRYDEIYSYVAPANLRDLRITERDIPLWHPGLENQPR